MFESIFSNRKNNAINYKGIFISFEGIEGSGKSTQINFLKKYLEDSGHNVKVFREPGGTEFGESLREAILNSKSKISPMAEAFLFASSRSQLIDEKILTNLKETKDVVIVDRFIDSSIAYQGFARKLGAKIIEKIHQFSPLDLKPDITFYLKIDLETSHKRQQERGNEKDYFERETHEFYSQLIQGYDYCAQAFPERIKTIDATNDIDYVFSEVKKGLKP